LEQKKKKRQQKGKKKLGTARDKKKNPLRGKIKHSGTFGGGKEKLETTNKEEGKKIKKPDTEGRDAVKKKRKNLREDSKKGGARPRGSFYFRDSTTKKAPGNNPLSGKKTLGEGRNHSSVKNEVKGPGERRLRRGLTLASKF